MMSSVNLIKLVSIVSTLHVEPLVMPPRSAGSLDFTTVVGK